MDKSENTKGDLNLLYFFQEYTYINNQVNSIRGRKGLLPSYSLGLLGSHLSYVVVTVDSVVLEDGMVGVTFVDPMDDEQEKLIEYIPISYFQEKIEWV